MGSYVRCCFGNFVVVCSLILPDETMNSLHAQSTTPSCWKCSGSGQLKVKIYNENQVTGLNKGAKYIYIVIVQIVILTN